MQQFLKYNIKKEFSWTKWKKEDITPLPQALAEEKKRSLETIKRIPKEQRTFENTIGALERADENISDVFCRLEVLLNAHTDKDVRDACATAITELSTLTTDMIYDEEVYNAVREYKEHGKMPTKASDIKLLNETLDAYRRLGFELPRTKRSVVQKLFKELQKITQEFDRNINEWRGSITVSQEELAGTPASYQETLPKNPDGTYTITTDYPSMHPFLTFAQNEKKREELWVIAQQKGGKKNLKVLTRILALRTRIAKLLGYTSWADYQLETYLAKKPYTAYTLIQKVLRGTKKKKDGEIKELQALKKKTRTSPLALWDIAFYDNKLKHQKYAVDQNELREHFPLTHVIPTLFSLFENILSIQFKQNNTIPTWHTDVFRYEVIDTKTQEIIGYLFLDTYPREGKYGHAAAFQTREPRRDTTTGLYAPPVVTLMCNFAKPTKNTISLLSHSDVETLFHEFGHAIHFLLTKAEYVAQSAFKTKMDFVEAPSQLLEHWCWDPKILKRLTKHYQTGKPLSNTKIQNLIRSQNHMEAFFTTRQMVQALLSLDIHTHPHINPQTHFQELIKTHLGFSYPPSSYFPAGFGHLGGYAAGYYVYIYSKVYGDDFASVFKKYGMTNKTIGMRYRKEILEQGALREEDTSAEAFLQRKVSPEAFLENITKN